LMSVCGFYFKEKIRESDCVLDSEGVSVVVIVIVSMTESTEYQSTRG
jgi:hypothetical protein